MAQIKQQGLHAFFFKLYILFGKIGAGLFIKHRNAYVTDFCTGQHLPAYRFHLNIAADNAHGSLYAVSAFKKQLHFRALFAAYFGNNIFQLHAVNIRTVNGKNFISGFYSGFIARCSFHRRNNNKIIVLFAKNHANAAKNTVRQISNFAEAFLVKVSGIRVAQSLNHAGSSTVKQLFIVNRFHIVITHGNKCF
mgnify:CR=1 FL=1